MLPHERQSYIRQQIQEQEHLKISQLSEALQVSEMTIYRDLKPLLAEGFIHKVYGGIALSKEEPSSKENGDCVLCGRVADARLAYRIIYADHVETACCSHCGLLRHQQFSQGDVQAIVQDFFSNTTMNAQTAWYVFHSDVDIRCCRPQGISFEKRETAERFVKGFNGQVYSFTEALMKLREEMNGRKSSDCGCPSE